MKIITTDGKILEICGYLKINNGSEFIYVAGEVEKGYKLHVNCEWYNFKCECGPDKRLGSTKKWVCNQCGLPE